MGLVACVLATREYGHMKGQESVAFNLCNGTGLAELENFFKSGTHNLHSH